jgi:hypothetical protein
MSAIEYSVLKTLREANTLADYRRALSAWIDWQWDLLESGQTVLVA